MASDSGADDAAALRERVAQLEETVAEQQATSESPGQPTASRRGFVKAAAAAAGLGALGIYSSYPASAQAAGQIGSASEPVDAELYDLNVQNQLAGDLDVGGNAVTNAVSLTSDKVTIDTQDTGDGNVLTTSRTAAPKALTVQPFSVELFPSPGNQRSHYLVCNAGDFNNFGFIKFEVDGTDGLFRAAQKGTGTAPTSLLFDSTFSDGIKFDSPTLLSPAKGSVTDAETHILTRAGVDFQRAGYETSGRELAGDNTARIIHTPSDPPASGLLVVTGRSQENQHRFTDVVVAVRNDAVSAMKKVDGNGPPGPRTYSLNGLSVELAVDDAGETFDIATNYIGGNS